MYYIPETKSIRIDSQIISHMEAPTRLSREGFRRAEIDMMVDPHDFDYTEHVSEHLPTYDSYFAKSKQFLKAFFGGDTNESAAELSPRSVKRNGREPRPIAPFHLPYTALNSWEGNRRIDRRTF